MSTKADVIARLQKDILSLQGFKPAANAFDFELKLGSICQAFPNSTFPLGAIHEFICNETEDAAATTGFISGVLGLLMKAGGASIWISNNRTVFPPALASFGIDPHNIIFINPKKKKDTVWTIEEALKCEGLSAVIGEVQEVDFTESRRMQLAVENSGVTGFLFRHKPRNLATACIARWNISHLPGETYDMPGVGHPFWQVDLLKVRNGKPGSWQIGWQNGKFITSVRVASIVHHERRKTG